MENWKAIAGYGGQYEVSDLGRVKSLNYNRTGKEKILKLLNHRGGYLQVTLCKDGHVKNMLVHRLVAQAFIPNPDNLETINHKDEVKTNNVASNLEWMSPKDNCNYGTRNKRVGEAVSKAKLNNPKTSTPVQMLDKQGNLLATFPSTHEAGRVTGISQGIICKCCNGKKYKSAGSYIWRYI